MHPSTRRVSSLPSRARSNRFNTAASGDYYFSESEDSVSGAEAPAQAPPPTSAGRRSKKKDSGDEEYRPGSGSRKAPKPPRSPLRSPMSELKKALSRPSLKREATSPVYLDPNSIAVPSNPSPTARRVAPCGSSRLRSSGSDVASIASSPENISGDSPPAQRGASGNKGGGAKGAKAGVQRNKWTKEETEALVRGCNTHGIGQWKAIRDGDPVLTRRSPGDLKDRFRTFYPDAYRKHYPNARSHMSDRQRSKDDAGNEIFGENSHRRERKQFSAAEDDALKRGYAKHGTAWSSIARDPLLANRKSTDLRDRFRNTFPSLYSAASGYKQRPRKLTADLYSLTTDDLDMYPAFAGSAAYADTDGSMYSTYSNRAMEMNMRKHLPPLDFLKTHRANAFDYGNTYPIGDVPGYSTVTEDQVAAMHGMQAVMTPRPGSVMTPRPPNYTPRPNDTTPRPRGSLIAGMAAPQLADVPEMAGALDGSDRYGLVGHGSMDQSMSRTMVPSEMLPYRPHPHFIHKTQSSIDLGHFSDLNLGVHSVGSHSASPSPGPGSAGYRSSDSSGPQSPDAGQPAALPLELPYAKASHSYSSPELGGIHDGYGSGGSLWPGSLAEAGITSIFPAHDPFQHGLDLGPNGLPGGHLDFGLEGPLGAYPTFDSQPFGFHNMSGIVNMPDANSSASSLQSSASDSSYPSHKSSQSGHDEVLYTRDDAAHLFGMTSLSPGLSAIASLPSAGSGVHQTLHPGITDADEQGGGFGVGGAFTEPE